MISITSFIFNPFQENTYVLYDHTGETVIIDPGCSTQSEQQELVNYIEHLNLKPVKLINTHCHTDHIIGNKFVCENYNIPLEIHEDELPLLETSSTYGAAIGIYIEESPQPSNYLNDGDYLKFGVSELKIIHTPGHSPGSVTLYSEPDKFMIVGDVLFLQSIGRADLPGGDMEILMQSIKEKLIPLGDNITVYPGHGPQTTIGFEKDNNPFLLMY